MKKRPLIGITPSVNSENFIRMRPAYLDSVWNGGGLPVFLSYTTDPQKLSEYAEQFDGFLFSGGVDVDPKYYGEEKMFDSVDICAARDDFELALFEAVKDTGKPIFGICRGIQLINVALGGTLYQHMEGHSQKEKGTVREQHVAVAEGSLLEKIVGKKDIKVNSFHHQAIKDVAPSLLSAGEADDGFCEAVWSPSHPFLLAVQWHPELFSTLDESSSSLFRAFVDAAR